MLTYCFTHVPIPYNTATKVYSNDLKSLIGKFSPNLTQFINKYKQKNIQKLNIVNKKTETIIHNNKMPFKSYIFNYYQMSSIEKASKIMINCSNSFITKRLNFTK